jgi:uncharacterized membrane protein
VAFLARIEILMDMLVAATAIACAAMGGVFFAFSSFVMRALARMPPAQGIAAMQSINVVAVTPVFMTALFGTAAACLAVAVDAVTGWRGATSAYLLAGSLSYLLGTIVVTIAFNVPLNNALAEFDPASGDAASFWREYVRRWTAWNHVRTASAVVAAALLLISANPNW